MTRFEREHKATPHQLPKDPRTQRPDAQIVADDYLRRRKLGVEGGPGVADHGALNGLLDDDHPQYVLSDGTRLPSMNPWRFIMNNTATPSEATQVSAADLDVIPGGVSVDGDGAMLQRGAQLFRVDAGQLHYYKVGVLGGIPIAALANIPANTVMLEPTGTDPAPPVPTEISDLPTLSPIPGNADLLLGQRLSDGRLVNVDISQTFKAFVYNALNLSLIQRVPGETLLMADGSGPRDIEAKKISDTTVDAAPGTGTMLIGENATGQIRHYDWGATLGVHIGTSAPTNKPTGRVWLDTSSGNALKIWDGSAWQSLAGGAPSGPAGGDLTGTYPNPTLAAGVVDTAELVANAVTAAKIFQFSPQSILANSTSGTADPVNLAAGTSAVFGRVGSGNLAFKQLTNDQIANSSIVFVDKLANFSATKRLLGSNSSGVSPFELGVGNGLDIDTSNIYVSNGGIDTDQLDDKFQSRMLYVENSTVNVFGSTTITDILNNASSGYTVAASTMGSNDVLRIVIEGYVQNTSGSSRNATGRLYWGGTQFFANNWSFGSDTAARMMRWELSIYNLGSTSSQWVTSRLQLGGGTGSTGIGDASQNSDFHGMFGNGTTTMAKATTSAQAIRIRWNNNTNHASFGFRIYRAQVRLEKGAV